MNKFLVEVYSDNDITKHDIFIELQGRFGNAIASVTDDVKDAWVIAKAPALLEALKALLEDVEYAQPQIKPGLIGNRQIKKARAIIYEIENPQD